MYSVNTNINIVILIFYYIISFLELKGNCDAIVFYCVLMFVINVLHGVFRYAYDTNISSKYHITRKLQIFTLIFRILRLKVPQTLSHAGDRWARVIV